MRIYGKTLPEILAEMPWQFKVIVMAGTIWIPFALIHATYIFSTMGKSFSKPGMVNIVSSPINASVADPSMAANGDNDTIYMAYTIITHLNDLINPEEGRWSPGIRLASTRPPCKVWSDIGEVVGSNQEVIPGPNSIDPLETVPGTWWLEHPALVYDPGDPGREYKLYYYKYLWYGPEKKALTRLYSIIAYKYTSNPNTMKWSNEEWLFSAQSRTVANPIGNPPEPFNSLVAFHLNEFDASLKDIYLYARPSVASLGGALYMTLSAFTQTGDSPDRVIMLGSLNHGSTWRYLGTLLHQGDAGKMGPYTKLGGGTLIKKKDKLYFAAVLGDAKVAGLGTFVIPFDDPLKALLQKDKKSGAPAVINHIPRNSVVPSNQGGGYAAYSDACRGTYVSEFSGLKGNYHIFSTLKDPVEH